MSLRIPYNQITPTYFNLTLGERLSTIGLSGDYTIYFTYEQTDFVYSTGFTDESLYPATFNTFYITTNLTGATDVQQVKFAYQGWYKYEVYELTDTTKTNRLELGKCYVYDDEDVAGNVPDETETYTNTKDKYVYQR